MFGYLGFVQRIVKNTLRECMVKHESAILDSKAHCKLIIVSYNQSRGVSMASDA